MSEYSAKIINTKQLLKNISAIKEIAGDSKICAMVKADAYGHGLTNTIPILSKIVDFFGVANIKESLQLRQLTDTKILIVGKTYSFDLCVKNDIDFMIDSLQHMLKLVDWLKNNPEDKCINIHIKINSGMNRLGVNSVKEFKQIYELALLNSINVEGIATHFATAGNDRLFFEKQYRKFLLFINAIPKNQSPIIHVGGSGVLQYKKCFDMVRVGIVLYGYNAEKISKKIKPVLHIESKLIKIITISKGEYVGYSKGFRALKDMNTGIVPLGYADGISRRLSNRGFVYVKVNRKWQKCNIIGNICMDMFMIDLQDFDIKEGDKVLVLKDAKKWSQILETIPYEILTGLRNLR